MTGKDGGGRVEDVTIFIGVTRMDMNKNEYAHQRDSTGGKVWRKNTRVKTEVVYGHLRKER